MNKLVSVIIHSFNRYEYLTNAIQSVLNQTFTDLEIILINDESTDERYYKDNFGKTIKQIDIKRNEYPRWTGSRQGLINVGLSMQQEKYIPLDDDDCWIENKLELQTRPWKKIITNFLQQRVILAMECMIPVKIIYFTIGNTLIKNLEKT